MTSEFALDTQGAAVVLRSPLLAAPHGFTTRLGGYSKGAYESLNCGFSIGDDPEAVRKNVALVEQLALVNGGDRVRTVNQRHGIEVVEVTSHDTPAPDTAADGLWTQVRGVALGIRTADCLPILIEDPVGHRVAAVHAGWRGVFAGIFPLAVAEMCARGSKPEDLRVAVGPCIQKCCFEVDATLASKFADKFGSGVCSNGKEKPHVDLPGSVVSSSDAVRLRPEQFDVVDGCTGCDDRFFSHRRQGGKAGRHLSFISCRFD